MRRHGLQAKPLVAKVAGRARRAQQAFRLARLAQEDGARGKRPVVRRDRQRDARLPFQERAQLVGRIPFARRRPGAHDDRRGGRRAARRQHEGRRRGGGKARRQQGDRDEALHSPGKSSVAK